MSKVTKAPVVRYTPLFVALPHLKLPLPLYAIKVEKEEDKAPKFLIRQQESPPMHPKENQKFKALRAILEERKKRILDGEEIKDGWNTEDA